MLKVGDKEKIKELEEIVQKLEIRLKETREQNNC